MFKIGDKVSYTVDGQDDAAKRVSVGTVMQGTVEGYDLLGVDIRWDNPKIMGVEYEYGMPRELFSEVETNVKELKEVSND